MSVSLINDCVALPHWINWREGLDWERRWRTEIAPGVTSAEDRATGAPAKPLLSLSYTANSFTPQEGARLRARILAALQRGRAVCPNFARAQYVKPQATLRAVESGFTSNAWLVPGLEVGKLYYYEPGPYDQQMNNSVSVTLRRAGFFRAALDTVTIFVSSIVPGTAGTIRRAEAFDQIPVDGLWPFAPGDYAFFLHRRPQSPETRENLALQINLDGPAIGDWVADTFYATGGGSALTLAAIDTSLVPQPAPEAVYQHARQISGNDPNAKIEITVTHLHPTIPCRVRCHFAEIISGFDGSTNRRKMRVSVTGQPSHSLFDAPEGNVFAYENVDPYRQAGNALNKATFCEFLEILPAPDGTLKITVQPTALEVKAASVGNVDLTSSIAIIDLVGILSGDLVLLKNQTDARQNGIYQKIGTDLVRWNGADDGREIEELGAVAVKSGSTNAGTYWRCTTAAPITLGTTALTFATTDTPFNAILNAVEVFQYLWEVPVLSAGTTAGKLKMATPLRGVYGARLASGEESQVFPALFGRLEVEDESALTPEIGEIAIRVSEPPGSTTLGAAGTCPVETAPNDRPLVITPGVSSGPSFGCGQAGTYFFGPVGGTQLPLYTSANPPTLLDPAVIAAWAADVWAQWQQEKLTGGYNVTQEQLRWVNVTSPTSFIGYDATNHYQMDLWHSVAFTSAWTIEVDACYTLP